MSEVKITPNGIKQAIADLLNEKELLQEENKRLYKSLEEQRHFYLEKLQQKENIIKEVREYIEKHLIQNDISNQDYQDRYKELLEILDKENK